MREYIYMHNVYIPYTYVHNVSASVVERYIHSLVYMYVYWVVYYKYLQIINCSCLLA